MRQRQDWVRAAILAAVLALAGAPRAWAQSCDEHNPGGPAVTGRILLGPSDFTNESRNELRSFVVTGSLGPVTAHIVAATPSGIVQSVSATPQISQVSPHFGERLKGVEVRVALSRHDHSVSVAVSLRQVCAQYFRDTFLY